MTVDRWMVEKLSPLFRVLCGIICLMCVVALIGVLFFAFRESVAFSLFVAFVLLFILYVCASIAFSGYPPGFLLWTLDKKK